MVTRILFDPRVDLPTGSTAPTIVIVDATPTRVREDGAVVILPTTSSYLITSSNDPITLAAPGIGWAWRLTVRQDGVIRRTRTVTFPDVTQIAWAALTDVDPATLEIDTTDPAWWAALAGYQPLPPDGTPFGYVPTAQGDGTSQWASQQGSGGGNGGQQTVFSTAVSVWNITHTLGRRPGIELYRLDGTRIYSDATATNTTATITFPAPQTGYAILN